MIETVGYAAKHSFSKLKPFEFERVDPKSNELARIGPDIELIEIAYISDAITG